MRCLLYAAGFNFAFRPSGGAFRTWLLQVGAVHKLSLGPKKKPREKSAGLGPSVYICTHGSLEPLALGLHHRSICVKGMECSGHFSHKASAVFIVFRNRLHIATHCSSTSIERLRCVNMLNLISCFSAYALIQFVALLGFCADFVFYFSQALSIFGFVL